MNNRKLFAALRGVLPFYVGRIMETSSDPWWRSTYRFAIHWRVLPKSKRARALASAVYNIQGLAFVEGFQYRVVNNVRLSEDGRSILFDVCTYEH